MAHNENDKRNFDADLDRPFNNDKQTVQVMSGFASGPLPHCNGSATPSVSADYMFCEVYILNRSLPISTGEQCNGQNCFQTSGGITRPSDSCFQNCSNHVAQAQLNSGTGEWEWNADGAVTVEGEASPSGNNNRMWVQARFLRSDMSTFIEPGVDESQYEVTTQQITPTAASGSASAPTSNSIDVEASGVTSNGLSYQNLSVHVFGRGNRMMLNGRPLRTSKLRVSASEVDWSNSFIFADLPPSVHRAAGPTLRPGSGSVIGFKFSQTPMWSINIWQPDAGTAPQVVLSDSAAAPDVLSLDPAHDIYVILNYMNYSVHTFDGSFGLLVTPEL